MNDGNLIGALVSMAFVGLIVGALARLAIPGPNPMGCLGTILAGIAGSFLAGLVGRVLLGPGYEAGLLASILGAVVVVYLFTRAGRNRRYY